MTDNSTENNITKLITKLSEARQRLLALPPEQALDAILESTQALQLIHSFPEEDFYFLINDIGIEDSLQLLSLASSKQWEYIIDIETWEKDTINNTAVTKWFDFLMQADPHRLINWLSTEQTEFFELYLFKNIEVIIREHDQDPSDFGDDFFTIDDIYYVRFIDYPFEQKPNKEDRENRNAVLTKMINLLAATDHVRYQQILLEAAGVVPAEAEEEIYRLRNVRLAEKGFLPFEEAIGVYQPIKPGQMATLEQKRVTKDADGNTLLPVPQYPTGMLKKDNLFTRSLQAIEAGDILREIQAEFSSLCNQIISADQQIIKEKDALKHIVKKSCGYISIGLQRLSNTEKPPDINKTAAMIQQYPLKDIFRTGFGNVIELKSKAENWKNKSWFYNQHLPLSFWGDVWMGILGGLLVKRPLYYDNYKTGVLFRDFESLSEISATGKAVDEIIEVDHLLSHMQINIKQKDDRFLTWKNTLLTLWGRHHLRVKEGLVPLTTKQFKRLHKAFFHQTKKADTSGIHPKIKTSFLNWVIAQTGIADIDISEQLRQTFENLFDEIENEYKNVAVDELDPRYIYLFLVK